MARFQAARARRHGLTFLDDKTDFSSAVNAVVDGLPEKKRRTLEVGQFPVCRLYDQVKLCDAKIWPYAENLSVQ